MDSGSNWKFILLFTPVSREGRNRLYMAFSSLLLCSLLLTGLTPETARAGEMLSGPVPAHVVKVQDGDSLKVAARVWLGQSIETNVRLAGVDTPELRGKCPLERERAVQARLFLEQRLNTGPGAGQVWLYEVQNGKYAGRVVARVVSASGEDLSQALLAAGLARPYHAGARGGWCQGS